MLLVPIADHDLRVAGVKFAAMPMLSIYPVLAQRHILFPSQPPSFVDAGFRDDLVASGHAPASLIVATTGNRVAHRKRTRPLVLPPRDRRVRR